MALHGAVQCTKSSQYIQGASFHNMALPVTAMLIEGHMTAFGLLLEGQRSVLTFCGYGFHRVGGGGAQEQVVDVVGSDGSGVEDKEELMAMVLERQESLSALIKDEEVRSPLHTLEPHSDLLLLFCPPPPHTLQGSLITRGSFSRFLFPHTLAIRRDQRLLIPR